MTRETDVFISGGGMVGLTLALALARGGLKTVVADPMPVAAALDAKFDGRVTALSYSSVRMFDVLGVWDRSPGLRAADQRHPRQRCRPRPRALAVHAAFRPSRDRPADGLHRREPLHPPGAARGAIRDRRYRAGRTRERARLHDHRCERHGRSGSRRNALRAIDGRRRRPGLAVAREDGHRPYRLVLSAMGNRGDGRTREAA